jgi:hypothetical protein
MKFVVLASLLVLSACTGIRSSVVRTGGPVAAYTGPVRVQSLGTPSGRQVGIVQVYGPRTVDELMPEFKQKVAEVGGTLGIVDKVASRFEMQTQLQTYTYSCGTSAAPRSCTGQRPVTVEVMTVQLLGRAFQE